MKNIVYYNLAFTSILSTWLLELGNDQQSGPFLSVFAFLIIMSGLILTDVKKIFSISEFICNVLIVIVLVFHIGYLIQSPTDFLAFSIANLLVYIQLILFFKRKDIRVCYHLLILSFIQVCVGCVFDQSLLFAFLLILYSFGLAGGISLLSLNHDKLYYESHSFLRPTFQKREKTNQSFFQRIRRFFIFSRSLFFPNQRSVAVHDQKTLKRSPLPSLSNSLDEPNLDYWEEIETNSLPFAASGIGSLIPKKRTIAPESVKCRLPLLRQRPSFSGNRRTGRAFSVSWELLLRLGQGTLFSLFFALVIFCLFPRLSDIEIGNVRLGYDGWRSGRTAMKNTVGFNENVQLGELGPIGDNHESVLTIRFLDIRRNNSAQTVPEGSTVYLRGVTMVGYHDRKWSRISFDDDHFDPLNLAENVQTFFSDWQKKGNNFSDPPLKQEKQTGQLFFPNLLQNPDPALFDSRNDFLLQDVVLQPLNSPVVFAVWPFFRISQHRGDNRFLDFDAERFIRNEEATHFEIPLRLMTNAFRNGQQVEIIPNQEDNSKYSLQQMLEIDEKSLDGLIKLAQSWDNAINLPKEDYIGRAKNIERQLRDSGRFSYSRTGIIRNRQIDPLEDFILNHPQGHCEYFAGALVMMLRAIGIPSRMVIGFKFEVAPNYSGFSTVRQSDAHSWVEAYIPQKAIDFRDNMSIIDANKSDWWANGGWLRLDATPYADTPLLTSVSKSYQSWNEWMHAIWNDYILNFNQHQQTRTFYQPILDAVQRFWFACLQIHWDNNLFEGIEKKLSHFMQSLQNGKWNDHEFAQTAIGLGLFLLTLYFGLKWLLLHLIQRFRQTQKTNDNKEIALQFYKRLEQLIKNYGIIRFSSETPWEFAQRFAQSTNQIEKIIFPSKELSADQQKLILFHAEKFSIQESNISNIILCQSVDLAKKNTEPPSLIVNNNATYPNLFSEEKKRYILLKLVLTIVEDYYRIHFGDEFVSDAEMKRIHSILNLLET